jgi:hypothetical protein
MRVLLAISLPRLIFSISDSLELLESVIRRLGFTGLGSEVLMVDIEPSFSLSKS